jgi:hypothetical protein
VENSLLSISSDPVTDLSRLPGVAQASDGSYRVRLRQTGNRSVELDQLGLGYVDHAPELEAFAAGATVVVGQSGPIANAWNAEGRPIAALTETNPDSAFEASRGQWVLVSPGGTAPGTALAIACRSAWSGTIVDSSGILVQVPLGEAAWQTKRVIHPRRDWDTFAVNVSNQAQVRLVFLGSYSVKALRRVSVTTEVAPSELLFLSASHTRLDDVGSHLGSADGVTTTLQSGDSLTVTFAAAEPTANQTREFYVLAKGKYLAPDVEESGGTSKAGSAEAVEYSFALEAARPNPSLTDLTIDYSLPRPMPVSLRVYDVAGRLVRTLVNESLEAGPHTVVWDGKNQSGVRAASGIYFYRMVAGTFRRDRRAILLAH